MLSNKQSLAGNIKNSIIVQASGSGTINLPELEARPSSINTLLRINCDHFQKRDSILREIAKSLKSNSLAILYGPGGVGKTFIAYDYASRLKSPIKIWIRTETIETIKEDYIKVANELKINVDKPLDEIISSVNQSLIEHYPNGLIIFDNVDSYDAPINPVRSNSSIGSFFPNSKQFHILITARNNLHCPTKAQVKVDSLSEKDAIALFERVSELKDLDYGRLSHFLNGKLGFSPLAITQAGFYIKNKLGALTDGNAKLEKYIKMFDDAALSIKAIEDQTLLPPDFTFHGQTPKIRQAIFTTYNIDIDSIEKAGKKANISFLEVLRYAALMHPDAIARKELYGSYQNKVASFDNEKQSLFQEELQKSSLVFFEESDAITMHRNIQLVLLLKIHDDKESIKAIIKDLISYFAAHYLDAESRISYANFPYILRNIDNGKLFYNYLNVSDSTVIQGMYAVACQYIASNEIDGSVLFLSMAIRNINKDADKQLYRQIKEKVIEVFQQLELNRLNKDWLKGLLNKLDVECRTKLIDILFQKEQELTQGDYYNNSAYYPTIQDFSSAIIEVYESITDKNSEQLAHAYYICGRAFREQAKGIKSLIENKMNYIQGQIYKRSWFPSFMTRIIGNFTDRIIEAQNQLNKLKEEFEEYYADALENLKASINLRKELNQYNSSRALLALIQITRLHQLRTIDDEPDLSIIEIAKHIIQHSDELTKLGNYSEDLNFCRSLIPANPSPMTSLIMSQQPVWNQFQRNLKRDASSQDSASQNVSSQDSASHNTSSPPDSNKRIRKG